jgi:magnesium-transporting ATPase (P-type)
LIFVIATNTTIGFVQEFQAEQTVEALRRMASPTARVIRNCGNAMHISANEVVPGDVLCFEEVKHNL